MKVDKTIEEYMEDEEFDVNILCSELAMSRTNLYNKFRALIGNSPNDYILSYKGKKATTILINEPYASVSDISIRLGFKTANYFTKTFKRLYGQSPLEYRKNKK